MTRIRTVRIGIALALLGCLILLPVMAEANAEDNTDKPAETLQQKTETPPATEQKPAETAPPVANEVVEEKDAPAKPKSSLADRLLEDLIGQAREQAGNPLDSIVERMRAAQQRLQKTETDKETRDLQAQVVKDLDELIEKLKNLKPPPKSNQNQPPPPPMGESDQNMPPRGGEQPKPQNSQKQPRGGAETKSQPTSSGSQPGDKSRQSTDQAKQQQQPRSPDEEAARQRMAKDVWGHLPPALRQQLLNVYSEKFLPKYDEQVRKYYEALAEQNRKNP